MPFKAKLGGVKLKNCVTVGKAKPGDTFKHCDNSYWMVVDTHDYTHDIGSGEDFIWAVCIYGKDFGELSYFGDGSPNCHFPSVNVEAVIKAVAE